MRGDSERKPKKSSVEGENSEVRSKPVTVLDKLSKLLPKESKLLPPPPPSKLRPLTSGISRPERIEFYSL